MGRRSTLVTSDNSEEESGDVFTDGDFGDSDEEVTVIETPGGSSVPVNETVNIGIKNSNETNGTAHNSLSRQSSLNRLKNGDANGLNNNNIGENGISDNGDITPSIVGIIGNQHGHVCIHSLFTLSFHPKYVLLCHCHPGNVLSLTYILYDSCLSHFNALLFT